MARKAPEDGSPITIKKYANRRLYNTATSSYITLENLAQMVRDNVEFHVVDAKSGADITHSILTQIIMEAESSGEQMLPVSFLRQLIGMYGDSMQTFMPSYLEASMANFRANQEKIRDVIEKGLGNSPLAKLHETNMAMMRAATDAFISKPRSDREPGRNAPAGDDEIALLRTQMDAMQKKLDELSK